MTLPCEDALRRAVFPQPIPEFVDLERAIAGAGEGVTIIAAECGAGKTDAAEKVAVARKKRTCISVDKTALAEQVCAHLRELGEEPMRYFGPLSHKTDGEWTCIHRDVGAALVSGGQSLQWELCEGRGRYRCSKHAFCAARKGYEGPDDAKVAVGPHQLIHELAERAGKTGLLIVDEPPAAVQSSALSLEDLRHAEDGLGSFTPAYQDAVKPLLEACFLWMRETDSTESADLKSYLPEDAQVDGAPALKSHVVRELIWNKRRARSVARASRVLTHLVTAAKHGRVARSRDLLVCAWPDDRYRKALTREGRTVLTDAGGRLHLPVVQGIVGYEPKLVNAARPDGARVERTWLVWKGATKKAWVDAFCTEALAKAKHAFKGGEAADAIARAEAAVEESMLFVGGKHAFCSDLLEAAAEVRKWAGSEPYALITWKALAEDPAFKALFPGARFAWYGATRGMNWVQTEDIRALVTMGDPRQNVSAVGNESALLGVDVGSLVAERAAAELEQAHGRLRVVHRRGEKLRALHVGAIQPWGYGWSLDDVARIERRARSSWSEQAFNVAPEGQTRFASGAA